MRKGRGDLHRASKEDIKASLRIESEFHHDARDIARTTHDLLSPLIDMNIRKRRLVDAFRQMSRERMKPERGACITLREEHGSFIDVFLDRIKRHTTAVHTPAILVEGVELRGDKRLENRGMQMLWNA